MADVELITYHDSNPDVFLQSNKAATNLLFPSEPPVNTTVTLAANEYTLWIEGTGSITSSYGTATAAIPLVFTGTAVGVLFTIVGTVDIAQIQSGNVKTNYIPTTTAVASIPETIYTFPTANIDPSSANLSMKIDYSGDDTDILTIGAIKLLEVVAGNLVLSDGTNTLSTAIAEGQHTIQIYLTATQMVLSVSGDIKAGIYTPVAAGTITLSEDAWQLTDSKTSSISYPAGALVDGNGDYLVDGSGNILTA